MKIVITTEKLLNAGEIALRYGTAATVGVITGVLTQPVRGTKLGRFITDIGSVGIAWVIDGQVTDYYRKNIKEPILEIQEVREENEQTYEEWKKKPLTNSK